MNIRFSNLLIVVGAILISSALFSAVTDVGRAMLSHTGEQRDNSAIQVVKLRRSLLEKARVSPDKDTKADLPVIERLPLAEKDPPAMAQGAKVTAAEAEGLPGGDIPTRIVIPAIGLDAPVIPAGTAIVNKGGQDYQQWMPPNQRAAGWHEASALLGQPGNTVINGHHNIYGQVFARLIDLEPGDILVVFDTRQAFVYQVTNKMLLREKYQALDVRMDNARWILPSEDERLTLVTCWPPETNTHRLIIVARPLGSHP